MENSGTGRKRKSFGRGLLFFALGVLVLMGLSTLLTPLLPDLQDSEEKIAVVEVTGLITDSAGIVSQLSKYRRDASIQGIILRIDSPGGSVAPAQEIYNEILKVKKDSKMIFASMGSLAASGGYYIASAADLVMANPGTLTGSIGVIMAFSNIEELIGKIGLRPEVIKSGKYKDTGSPARPMAPDERRLLQRVVNDVHQQFVEAVAKGRNLPIERVKKLADGRIYTGRQALTLKLVDQLGGLEDTIELLAQKVGIAGRPTIVRQEEETTFFDWLLQSLSPQGVGSPLIPPPIPSLLYLWTLG